MFNGQTIKSNQIVSAKQAKCYLTFEGKRYHLFNAINVQAEITKTKKEFAILGKTGNGNRSTGWKSKAKAKFYRNNPIFVEMLEKFKETGEDIYFDMQFVNEDPASEVGRQSVILIDCNIDGGVLASFDAEGDFLTDEIDFTFEDFKIPEKFKLVDGML